MPLPDISDIDPANRHFVGSNGHKVLTMASGRVTTMTPIEAMVHAAWLYAIAEIELIMSNDDVDQVATADLFGQILEKVQNS